MTTQRVFGVQPEGACLRVVPLPTPTPCTTQGEICVRQLQNFLNAIRPGAGIIPAGTHV